MKTILVTGGAGFIGTNYILYTLLTKRADVKLINLDKLTYAGNLKNLKAVEKDPRYCFVQGDICDSELLAKLFTENEIDFVVNFAAESHVDRSISDPEIFIKTNVLGTLALLNAAKKAWQVEEDIYREGCKFLQVSTDEVYGSLGAEGLFTETTPLDPRSPYSASKASADLLVKAYYDTYKFPVNITRCSNNYGPYQFPEKLIPLMINNALAHKKLPVYGDGQQIRDWLYVEDHCIAIALVLFQGVSGQIYNIGGNNERTNIQIVHSVIRYIHDNVDATVGSHLIQHVTDRKGHDRRYGIDPTKIYTALGWLPATPFEKGIKKTIRWYLDNRVWMDGVTSGVYQNYYKTMYESR